MMQAQLELQQHERETKDEESGIFDLCSTSLLVRAGSVERAVRISHQRAARAGTLFVGGFFNF
ncbi:hypothetical protein JA1_003366 [Spathaspora sp. JA1]|nr:hypothetical protein JA1_003366 [Spathaspora sp. JA1]